MNQRQRATTAILIFFGATLLYCLPPTGILGKEALQASALVVLAIGFWATGVLPEHLTALLFMLLAVILRVAPAQVVFSGFLSSAVWLVFGGTILAAAVKDSGLGGRLAQRMLSSLGTSYLMVIAGVVLLALLFAFFIPSTVGRVVLLVPLAMAMAERLGFSEGSPGRDGLVMAATLASYVPSCAVLPAAVPNMVAAGTAESLYNLSFTYGHYLKLHFPVIGVLKALAIIILIRLLFPAQVRSAPPETEGKGGPWGRRERALTFLLSVTLLVWGTDSFHGVSPAWVALAAAIVCLLPFGGLFSGEEFGKSMNFAPFFYVAGVLGMGAVVAKTGVGDALGRELVGLFGFEKGHDLRNFFSLVLISVALGPVTTSPGLPAVFSPLSDDLAAATGFPLVTVLMTQVIGFSTILFPYQVPPVVVGMQLGRVSVARGLRGILALAAVSIVLLTPVHFLWWSLLGVFRPSP